MYCQELFLLNYCLKKNTAWSTDGTKTEVRPERQKVRC